MKIMPCPLNGPRNIQEFICAGPVEPHPDPNRCSDDEWTEYVWMEENVAGVVREWWCHVATSYWFIAERNTVTDEILTTYPANRVFSERVTFEPLAPPPEAASAPEPQPTATEAKPEQPKEAAPPPEAPPPTAEPAQDAPTEAEGAPAEAAPQPPEESVPPPEPQPVAAKPSPEAPEESAAPSGEAPAKEGPAEDDTPADEPSSAEAPAPASKDSAT